jgi:hypothetical protein
MLCAQHALNSLLREFKVFQHFNRSNVFRLCRRKLCAFFLPNYPKSLS